MPGSPAAKLYTPDILELAVGLADYPLDPSMPYQGSAQSRTCGSTIQMSAELDGSDQLTAIGLQVTACAIGQAAAMIFAQDCIGRTMHNIAKIESALTAWLSGDDEQPDWPGIALLHNARSYPGRHDAILLPWKAAAATLSNPPAAR